MTFIRGLGDGLSGPFVCGVRQIINSTVSAHHCSSRRPEDVLKLADWLCLQVRALYTLDNALIVRLMDMNEQGEGLERTGSDWNQMGIKGSGEASLSQMLAL